MSDVIGHEPRLGYASTFARIYSKITKLRTSVF